ncbi:glycosyltransferase family 2 protein [Sphingomonas sp. Leaf37]|uniref:glycosyltransferase family 2 protein n=1 Tax=Sphingomonas sp. Leaf37 TaxID=2876552 RepID=UPI001E49C116|nr:glycosyltransferase family A protein [Sphingomonas sp. Leaf37]
MTARVDDALPALTPGAATIAVALGDAESALLFERARSDPRPCRVTIAIPTFNRPELLRETLASAWAQQDFTDYEVIVVDNASSPENVASVLAFLQSVEHPVRYYLNSENVGGFPNWNRCMHLARGEWISVLNDDDLLKPEFLSTMMKHVEQDPTLESLVCQAEPFDQRPQAMRKSRTHTMVRPAFISATRFLGRDYIRMTATRLFWSNIAGSSLGSLYKRDVVLGLGGFDPQEAPPADYILNVRLALRSSFIQVRAPMAMVRLQVNDSMNLNTMGGVLIRNFRLRNRMLAENLVPQRWKHWPRYLLAHEWAVARNHWKQAPAQADVARQSGVDLPQGDAKWVYIVRMLHGGM